MKKINKLLFATSCLSLLSISTITSLASTSCGSPKGTTYDFSGGWSDEKQISASKPAYKMTDSNWKFFKNGKQVMTNITWVVDQENLKDLITINNEDGSTIVNAKAIFDLKITEVLFKPGVNIEGQKETIWPQNINDQKIVIIE